MVTTNRSLVKYIIFTIITCGIYNLYFIYKLSEDVNIICAGDGEDTPGLLKYILLSIITCSIYAWYWYYKLGNRLNSNANRYGLQFQENGTTVILWMLLGSWICGLGTFYAYYIIIKNTNSLAEAYNNSRTAY